MSITYSVRPRYTAGSPAQVNEEQARAVARQEMEFYHNAKDGYWGREWKRKAEQSGIGGIVEVRTRVNEFTTIVEDLMTGTRRILSTDFIREYPDATEQ